MTHLPCLKIMVATVSLLGFLFSFAAMPAKAAPEADFNITLAEAQVSITTGFSGSTISVFGVRPKDKDIALSVLGPSRTMVVRKKASLFGMWLNRSSIKFREVPVYYDYAVSNPEPELSTPDVLKDYQLGLDYLPLRFSGKHDKGKVERFRAALVQNKQVQGHFPLEPRAFTFLTPSFFRADFYVPSNVPTGDYFVKAMLFEDGAVIKTRTTELKVAQVGTSAAIHDFAYGSGFFYGMGSILFAVLIGALAYFVAEDNEEFDLALYHAARRAEATDSRVGVLQAISMDDFQHWQNVEDMMKKELREHAEKFMWHAAKKIHEVNGLYPIFYIVEGDSKEEVVRVMEEDSSIKALVLAGKTHGSNSGSLVSYFTGKGLAKLSVPLILVPGHLERSDIDSFPL
jgi:uncharacterized protein (TIGR02186 family)